VSRPIDGENHDVPLRHPRRLAVGLGIFLSVVFVNATAQTLTGAQAQKSPQADVFLAYEKALLWQGIDAAAAHMTAERLERMKAQIQQFGADGFKQMQEERRKSTPQGEPAWGVMRQAKP
jgi:hypothetical protein